MTEHQKVFFVLFGGSASPVIAAIEEQSVIEDGEFVMHVVLGSVDSQPDAALSQPVCVGAEVGGFVVVGNDADFDAAAMGFNDAGGEAIVCDGEHADIECFADGCDQFTNFSGAVLLWAEPCAGGHVGVFG